MQPPTIQLKQDGTSVVVVVKGKGGTRATAAMRYKVSVLPSCLDYATASTAESQV